VEGTKCFLVRSDDMTFVIFRGVDYDPSTAANLVDQAMRHGLSIVLGVSLFQRDRAPEGLEGRVLAPSGIHRGGRILYCTLPPSEPDLPLIISRHRTW
jgi:hypothetical protein